MVAICSGASDEQLAEILRDRIQQGFLNAGLADVEVGCRLDTATNRFRVDISEGPRYVQGHVIVDTAGEFPISQLVAELQEPRPDATAAGDGEVSLWQRGEPAQLDATFRRRLPACIAAALERVGFPQARFRVEMTTDLPTHTVDLVVHLENPGQPDRVDEIKVSGTVKQPPEVMLNRIGLCPGIVWNWATERRLEAALRKTGRFLSVHLSYSRATSIYAKSTVYVTVEEYSEAPRMDENLSRDESTVLKMAEWLRQWPSRQDDLVITTRAGSRQFTMISSPKIGSIAAVGTTAAAADAEYAAIFADGSMSILAFKHHKRITIPWLVPASLTLVVKPSGDPAHPFCYSLGIGGSIYAGDGATAATIAADIWPACCLMLLRDDRAVVRWSDDQLEIDSPRHSLRLQSQNGAVLDWQLNGDTAADHILDIQFIPGAYLDWQTSLTRRAVGLSDAYEQRHPVSSIVKFLTSPELVADFHDAAADVGPTARLQSLQAFAAWLHAVATRDGLALVDSWASQYTTPTRFTIPDSSWDIAPGG